jgi:hypothetical protein
MKMQRWTALPPMRELPDGETEAEARAGQLLRSAIVAEPLDASSLADIHDRLPDERRPAPRRLVLRLSLAVALFLAGGGVVMSATLLGRWAPFRTASAPAVTVPVAPAPARRRAAAPASVTPALAAEVAPLGASVEPAPRARRARPTAVEPAPLEADLAPSATPAPAPSAIAEEAGLVGAALRKLREQGDAAGALALLDEHDSRFSEAGGLADEARTTRVEALLRLGEHGRALALLDEHAPRPSGRGRELLASRGELRANAGRCREAVADFDALLGDETASDGVTERALYGRAACRARLGAGGDARADLEAYVARFPAGQFAARARAALAR